jgi:hypothetical protein
MRPIRPMLSQAHGTLVARGITLSQLLFQLLVTIAGVYIAIHLQDAADQRGRARDADRTLRAVSAELREDEATLASIIADQQQQTAAMREIASAVRSPDMSDSTLQEITVVERFGNRTFFTRAGAYSALVSTGQIEHIANADIRIALAQIYEHDYDRVRTNGALSDQIWQDVFRRAQLEYWDYEMQRPIAHDALAATRMSNAAHRVARYATNYVGVMEGTRARVHSTRAMIDDYLPSADD